uniref:Uncharacterized protein n=1 Tax=Aegilops tauschii subsp. strangulata TaxID=200361 RepID=A0A452ZTL9_AEGTS
MAMLMACARCSSPDSSALRPEERCDLRQRDERAALAKRHAVDVKRLTNARARKAGRVRGRLAWLPLPDQSSSPPSWQSLL